MGERAARVGANGGRQKPGAENVEVTEERKKKKNNVRLVRAAGRKGGKGIRFEDAERRRPGNYLRASRVLFKMWAKVGEAIS